MAPQVVGRKSKLSGRGKNDARSLKRKRDVDDLEKLQKAVEELVRITLLRANGTLKFSRTPKQK